MPNVEAKFEAQLVRSNPQYSYCRTSCNIQEGEVIPKSFGLGGNLLKCGKWIQLHHYTMDKGKEC